MKGQTKQQLVDELAALRQRISELEASEPEHKRSEKALLESEARWYSLTMNSPDHILALDMDLNIQFVNYASPGLTLEELI
ncbi:MAG: hypothetical protein KJ734_01340, partial [Chloroflexi bacterium]|nr:hypothetical protein [Chloroflexota bacterium]